ncbi:MAG: hypothetical protein ACK5Q2_04205 [Bacteroidota bacterium]|jgi:hypothetical protein
MKKQIALIGLWYALALVGTGITTASGQSSPRISMQGTLTDAAGKSVADGKYNITFRLYTQPVGGTALWQETAEVAVDGAIYSHYLGSVQPLDAFYFVNTLYLGIQLDADEITPRTVLTYAPYAFAVNTAKTVVCSGAVGDVKHSILNPVQFAERNGDCWVPMNGTALPPDCKLRQITGMTNLPDAGGLFIRGQEFSGGQDNDPDRTPSSAIATVESDAFKAHSHPASYDGNHTHNFKEYVAYGGYVPDWLSNTDSGPALNNDQIEINLTNRISYAGDHAHNITDTGGSETRVKNLNFWVYIRIN